jgi:hypothetical protein
VGVVATCTGLRLGVTTSHPRTFEYSTIPLWEPQISQHLPLSTFCVSFIAGTSGKHVTEPRGLRYNLEELQVFPGRLFNDALNIVGRTR